MAESNDETAAGGAEDLQWDSSQMRKIQAHPCFSKEAIHLFGRIHLPVAPECNIQCNYCIRKFDCVNESRPGVTSRVLSPEEAVSKVREVLKEHHYIKVVGVAGPGEPLYNEETFETFKLLQSEFPMLLRCVSTNGLLLPDKIDELHKLDVSTITVTLNALNPEIGKKIYSWVKYNGKKIEGREAAELLVKKQVEGIREALKRKIIVKVNTVLIPGINDTHIVEIAERTGKMGVFLQNIIPLIPQYKFKEITPPTQKEKREIQNECSHYIKQMTHCRQCRADAAGKLGKDVKTCMQ
ncbi:MAG: nitrogenase cofactor biosynthesis protein NifB [Methanosarcinales archaeon]